ncbi:Serine/threonine-protein kinase PknD [compost metagenome]
MRDALGAEVATTSTTISVFTNDAVSNAFLSLNVPPTPVFTLAGLTSSPGFVNGQGADGDNLARLSSPGGIVLDYNTLYVADTGNHSIRSFNLSNQSISASSALSTIAGNGQSGFADDGFSGLNARFDSPGGIAVDNSGNLYVADTGNHRIRMLTKSGADWTVSTIAGNGFPDWADGTGTGTGFNSPKGIAVDNSGNLYVADTGNHAIRKLTKSGANWLVNTLAGNSMPGFVNATGPSAKFNSPSGVVFYNGNLYVADTNNHAIRRVSAANGAVDTIAGAAPGIVFPPAQEFINGIGNDARFNLPSGIASDGNGNLFVTDSGNHAIRKIPISNLNVSTLTGAFLQPGSGFQDGSLAQATFNNPLGISNYYGMKLFVVDSGNHAIRMITP